MRRYSVALSIVAVLAVVVSSSAVPKPDEKRVMDFDLSDTEHFRNEEHNAQYDHEAFLGKDDAKTFDQLPPEESQRRLGVIVDRIDANNDTFVDLAELKSWIQFTQRRYIEDDVDRQWRQHNKNDEDSIAWESYRKTVYGFMDDMDPKDLEREDEGFSYKSMLIRDRRRWSFADKDGDDRLTRLEFTDFLHPEDSPRMRDIVVTETLEDIDKNNDGKLSIEEYIGDMYRGAEEGDEEPEWVRNERETFGKFRDKDQDGFMSNEEVRDWIIPNDFDHAEAEAKHLIYEADVDADEKLTKEEIIEKYDIFVGSQATDFGEALGRHDEF